MNLTNGSEIVFAWQTVWKASKSDSILQHNLESKINCMDNDGEVSYTDGSVDYASANFLSVQFLPAPPSSQGQAWI